MKNIVRVIKVRENQLDRVAIGGMIDVYEGYVPDGYEILENVDMETINENPPEIGFWETIKLIFGRK